MEACAVICRKATFTVSIAAVALPDANPPPPEHKIGVFVLGDGHRVSVPAITGADFLSLACPTASTACIIA